MEEFFKNFVYNTKMKVKLNFSFSYACASFGAQVDDVAFAADVLYKCRYKVASIDICRIRSVEL